MEFFAVGMAWGFVFGALATYGAVKYSGGGL
jgi:hypothetical protein